MLPAQLGGSPRASFPVLGARGGRCAAGRGAHALAALGVAEPGLGGKRGPSAATPEHADRHAGLRGQFQPDLAWPEAIRRDKSAFYTGKPQGQGSLRDRKPSPLNHRTQTRASQLSEGCEPAARRSTHSGPTHTHTTLTECGRTDYGHVCDCSTRTPTPAHMIAHCKGTGTYLHTAARGRFRASPNSPHHSGDLPTSTRARAPAMGREPAWSHQPQPIQNHPEFSTSSWTRVAGASEMGNTAHLFS